MSQFPQSVVIPSKREGSRFLAALEMTQEEDEPPTSGE